MDIADIYACAPGSRFLVACPSGAQEDMLYTLCASMPPTFQSRAALNSSAVASMDMAPDDNPNRFSDLIGLCTKLISAAGWRSHFEGLLILNIAALASAPGNAMRLKALGELLAMQDGLASQCITLLYGPESERDILTVADPLDFDGRLKVIRYEPPARRSLAELLAESKLRCASPQVGPLLESTLADMAGYADFNAAKFIRICGNSKGLITEGAVSALLNDPYSYVNRIQKAGKRRGEDTEGRRIGFRATR